MEAVQKIQQGNITTTRRINTRGMKPLTIGGLALILVGLSSINFLIGLALGILILLIAIISPRPILIVYGLAFLLPLTGGLERGALIPLLRVSQALVVFGFILFVLSTASPQGKSRLSIIDMAFMLYLLAGAVFPLLALYYNGEPVSLSATSINYTSSPIQTLLGPLQYYILYRIVVAIVSSDRQIRVFLKLIFASSILVSVIGIMQKLNIAHMRTIIQTYYPAPSIGYDIAAVDQRITSTLQHYSGLGAYLTFTIILVLVCYAFQKQMKISSLLLAATLLFDSIALVLTGTFSAWIGLVVGGILVLIMSRRFPKILIFIIIGILVAIVIFFPFLSIRLNNELGAGAAQGLIPQSLALRIQIWEQITLPAIGQHLFFGLGPNPLPNASVPAEDSQYIHLLLEGGILYLISYFLLMGAATFACWQQIKQKSEGVLRPLAIATLSILITLNVMNISGEYFTYVGGPQTIWMLLAIVIASGQIQKLKTSTTTAGRYWLPGELSTSASSSSQAISTRSSVIRRIYAYPYSLIPNYSGYNSPPDYAWSHLLDWSFVKDSLIISIGSTLARVLALVFMIVLARFLTPDDFGIFRYALTVVGILIIVPSSSPVSISRFLAAHSADHQARNSYFTNGMIGIIIVLIASLIISIPILYTLHILTIGTIVCIISISGFYIYFALIRGLNSAWKMGLTYAVSNLALILVLLLVFGIFKIQNVTAALVIYGATNLIPILILELVRPMAVRFQPGLISKAVLRELSRFALPLVISSGAYTIWAGLDVLLVQYFEPKAVGSYAAAKTLSQAFIFIPTAISMTLMPRVAARKATSSKRYITGAVLVTLLLSLMGWLLVYLFGHVIIALTFGHRYVDGYVPLVVLSVAMSILSVYTILEGFVVGNGKPHLPVQALIIAMVSTGITGFFLTPMLGTLGASLAFTIGAASGCADMLVNIWLSQRKKPGEVRSDNTTQGAVFQ